MSKGVLRRLVLILAPMAAGGEGLGEGEEAQTADNLTPASLEKRGS